MNSIVTQSVFAVFLALSSVAFSEENETAGQTAETAQEYWESAPPVTLQLGGGLAYFDGKTGWALSAGLLRRLTEEQPLFLGVDLALNFWKFSSTVANTSSSATGIGLLPSLVYGFDMGSETVRPYIGVAAGPHLYSEERTTPAGASVSETRVYLQVLLKPGANLAVSKWVSLNLEPKFGLLSDDFVFLPTVTAVVAL